MSELIVGGDRRPLEHLLPPIPTERVQRRAGHFEDEKQVNAVAQCARCGWLFVSREDPDGWGRVVYWTRLRWWHRTARRKLRAKAAPVSCDCRRARPRERDLTGHRHDCPRHPPAGWPHR